MQHDRPCNINTFIAVMNKCQVNDYLNDNVTQKEMRHNVQVNTNDNTQGSNS